MNGTNIKLRYTILNAKIIIYACFVLVWCLSWKIGFFYFQKKKCHFTFRVFIQKKGWADILLPIHSMSTVIGSAFSKSSAASRCSVAFSTVPWFIYSCLFFLVLWIRSRNAISTDWPWSYKQTKCVYARPYIIINIAGENSVIHWVICTNRINI